MNNVLEPADLSSMNTLLLPCKAKRLIKLSTNNEVKQAYSDYNLTADNCLVMGAGSNLVLPEDLGLTVLQYIGSQIQFHEQADDSVRVDVDAGVNWDDLVKAVVDKGLRGIENLSLIPGTAGAAPVQNIGAYGVELADVLDFVDVYNVVTQKFEKISKIDCDFNYRDSLFKQHPGQYFIIKLYLKLSKTALFTLDYGELKPLQNEEQLCVADVRSKVIAVRRAKLPDPKELPNVGSFFKNPIVSVDQAEHLRSHFPDLISYDLPTKPISVKLAAAWLIDYAGWKGYRNDRVGVHDQQALVLVNHAEGSQHDILSLVKKIQDSVCQVFQIKLEPEPIIIMPSQQLD